MKSCVLAVTTLFWGKVLMAALFGGEPYAVINEGQVGHVIVGASLLADRITLAGDAGRPEGDTCLEESTLTLDTDIFSSDLRVLRAYLIWTGAVDPAKLDEATDNVVHFSFDRSDGYRQEAEIVAGDTARHIGDESASFLFESLRFPATVPIGCSELDPGAMTSVELAYFTYRVEVTDLFAAIPGTDQTSGLPFEEKSAAFRGDYTVSDLDCTEDDAYRCPGLMVSNWALLLLLEGNTRDPRTVYLYPGLSLRKNESVAVTLSGRYDITSEFEIEMTMLSAEGDRAVAPATEGSAERIFVWDALWKESEPIVDDCDPDDPAGPEIWDSRGSQIFFTEKNGATGYCANFADYTYGLDIDHWRISGGTADQKIMQLWPVGTDELHLSFDFSDDEVLTNLLVVSSDLPYSDFDIPGADELRNCPCAPEETREVFCPGAPQYVLVRVENWGKNLARSVYLQADYDTAVFDYVPGTAEIASRFDGEGNGLNWQRFLDGPDGGFPLAAPNLIANELVSVKVDPDAETYLVRFQLLPRIDPPKNAAGSVHAFISDETDRYPANRYDPLLMVEGTCGVTCTEKELQEQCGGRSSDGQTIYDPEGNAAGDLLPDADNATGELPDAVIDPRATHPMSLQTPGCALTLF